MRPLLTQIAYVFIKIIATAVCLIVLYYVVLYFAFPKTGSPLISSSIRESKRENVFITEMVAIKNTKESFVVESAWIERSSHKINKRKYGLFYQREIDDYCHLVFTMNQEPGNKFSTDNILNWRIEYKVNGEHIGYAYGHDNIYELSIRNCNVPDSIVLELMLENYMPKNVGTVVFKPL